jgi:hypothetical protein
MHSIRKRRLARALAAGGVVAGLLAIAPVGAAQAAVPGPVAASVARASFVSFPAFLRATASAGYRSYARAGRAGGVRDARAFGQMRGYVLATYRGVRVTHSFQYGGSYWDCVTIGSQPTVRDLRLTHIARPPAASPGARRTGHGLALPLTLGLRDGYGHAVACPAGTVPMQRLSLARMTRFPTLAAFLAKGPGSAGRVAARPAARARVAQNTAHRYAIGYQNITNYGGASWLNVWNPSGTFSLSQQWYANGSGAGTQTVEGGWIHYPAVFGSKSVLFIFSTPNNYTSGCYNLMCAGFVQTSSVVPLGATFTNYSSYGGTQWGFGLQWKYYNGNWWMFYSGSAVGYYPGSVFSGGPMASNASLTEYGGETFTPSGAWPQMGSGKFASAGWTQAAFQNSIFYIPQNVNGGTGVWSSLTSLVTNPACYTFAYTPAASGGSWGTYFYFGGPGGNC